MGCIEVGLTGWRLQAECKAGNEAGGGRPAAAEAVAGWLLAQKICRESVKAEAGYPKGRLAQGTVDTVECLGWIIGLIRCMFSFKRRGDRGPLCMYLHPVLTLQKALSQAVSAVPLVAWSLK